ncbi:MAG: DedA family protein [Gemmatimonadaceae bacterium]
MPLLQNLLDWLMSIPPALLLPTMALLAAVENIFPPIPADMLVAFGGFISARTGASPWPAFLAVWLGSVTGAVLMYALGRRVGTAGIRRRFHLGEGTNGERRLIEMHKKYGVAALFVSRFLPGIRSLVPPMVGAMRIPPFAPLLAISFASALWYGFVTYLAFRAGNNWEVLSRSIASVGRWTAVGAALVAAAGATVWWIRRRRGRA